MADQIQTVAGSHKKAISDGTELRKQVKGLAARIRKISLAAIGLIAFVRVGYQFFGWVWSPGDASSDRAVVVDSVPTTVRSGEVKAFTNDWSSWLNVLDNECVYWQGVDPTGNRFEVQYVSPRGDILLYDGTPLTKMRGVRFRSLTGSQEKVIYRIVSKKNGQC